MKLPRTFLLLLLLLPLLAASNSEADFTAAREKMVKEQILERGITDPRILNVFRKVKRHLFVSPDLPARRGLRRLPPAHRGRPDHLPALYRGHHDLLPSPPKPARRSWRSAPARATRRPCWPSWSMRSIPSRSTPTWPTAPRNCCPTWATATSAAGPATVTWAGPRPRPLTGSSSPALRTRSRRR